MYGVMFCTRARKLPGSIEKSGVFKFGTQSPSYSTWAIAGMDSVGRRG